jgi:hypothetical protein
LTDNHPDKILCCGRRWGKSYISSLDALITAALGGHVWIVAPTYGLSEIVFEEACQMAQTTNYADILLGVPRMAKGQQRLMTKTGGRVSAMTTENESNLIGRGLDLIIFDEAAKDDRGKKIINEKLNPTLADRNGAMVKISTPMGNNWFKADWLAGQVANDVSKSWRYPSWYNPHVSREYLRRMKAETPSRDWQQEYCAQFLDDGGGVFRGVQKCTYKDFYCVNDSGRIVIEKNGLDISANVGRYVMGVDIAVTVDWTVIVVIDAMTREVVYLERFNKISWPYQKARILGVAERFGCPMIMDSTGMQLASKQDVEASSTHDVIGFSFSHASKAQLVTGLAFGFEQGTISIPDHPVVIGELQAFAYTTTPSGLISTGAPHGQHDDIPMAMALAWKLALSSSGGGVNDTDVVLDPTRAKNVEEAAPSYEDSSTVAWC